MIAYFFYALFFLVPLVLYPSTSELFEFNKMVVTYALTILIVASWLVRMISKRKIIFRRTILDVPLILFILSQVLATLTSIDIRTSFFGYYSRFHGGLFSTLSYSLLYWAFVSNMDKVKTLKSLKFLFISTLIASVWGVLEHFGIDKNIWVQDVQLRVFSTFGQPNWLAAWLTIIIPLSWYFALNNQTSDNKVSKNFWVWGGFSSLLFLTLLFTKSRSGFLGFLLSALLFWAAVFWKNRAKYKKILKPFLFLTIPLFVIFVFTPTPFSSTVGSLFQKIKVQESAAPQGPALEVGGTESGEIRKIVWKGAYQIWKHNPLLGTGPETFAYSYYQFRPVEHNLVSEWDFLYNKAHNEFLNIAATTGSIGLITYLFLIFSIIRLFVVKSGLFNTNVKLSLFPLSSLASFFSILVTNFFGFSVVPVGLLFFLLPALTLSFEETKNISLNVGFANFKNTQKLYTLGVALVGFWLLINVGKYWYADFLFAKGKALNDSGQPVAGRENLVKAVRLSKREAIFWDELSQSSTDIAIALDEAGEKEKSKDFAKTAISESQNAINLSPRNLNLRRSRFSLFIKMSILDELYLTQAKEVLLETLKFSPTDAKLFYNLGITYVRLGETDPAIKTLEDAIRLKSNYKEARLAYAFILIDKGEKARAKEELNYILNKIDPNDSLTLQTLEEIR